MCVYVYVCVCVCVGTHIHRLYDLSIQLATRCHTTASNFLVVAFSWATPPARRGWPVGRSLNINITRRSRLSSTYDRRPI